MGESYRSNKGLRKKDLIPRPISVDGPKPYDFENMQPGERYLTDKQAIFVAEYCRDGNGTRAAKAAGVSPESAGITAIKWLNDKARFGHVIKAVQKCLADKRKACEIDSQRVVKELADIAFLDPSEAVDENDCPLPLRELPKHVLAAVKRMKVSYKLGLEDGEPIKVRTIDLEFHDKLQALNQIAKHLGLLREDAHYHQHVHIDWQTLFTRQPPEQVKQQDIIEQKLVEVERLALPKPEDKG